MQASKEKNKNKMKNYLVYISNPTARKQAAPLCVGCHSALSLPVCTRCSVLLVQVTDF